MTSPQPPWVIVLDDDIAVRVALQNLLTAAGWRVATFPSAAALLDDPRLREPCCLVLDLRMPGLSGLDVQATLHGSLLDVPIVFLTAHGNVAAGVEAMKRGAVDFLEKPVDPGILMAAVKRALARGADAREGRARQTAYRARLGTLSAREREVLDRLVTGRANRQIARDLEISERTVKFHRANIMEKTQAGSLAELARMVAQVESWSKSSGD